jgi:hypothetical protein
MMTKKSKAVQQIIGPEEAGRHPGETRLCGGKVIVPKPLTGLHVPAPFLKCDVFSLASELRAVKACR